jgi:hypothetical protein
MSSSMDKLARWRTLGARYSEEVLELAPRVLKSGGLGDQGLSLSQSYASLPELRALRPIADGPEWAVREQLAIAALDLGRISIATVSASVNHLQSMSAYRIGSTEAARSSICRLAPG